MIRNAFLKTAAALPFIMLLAACNPSGKSTYEAPSQENFHKEIQGEWHADTLTLKVDRNAYTLADKNTAPVQGKLEVESYEDGVMTVRFVANDTTSARIKDKQVIAFQGDGNVIDIIDMTSGESVTFTRQ